MRRFLLTSLLLLVPAMLVAPDALADAPKDVKKMTTDDCAKARAANKTCVISIEGIDVEGGVKGPGGERIDILKHGDHASLIRLRFDFIPEILKTAEDL